MAMAIDHPPHVSLSDQQKRVDWEGEGNHDEKAVVWAFLWTLFAFKIVTILTVLWVTHSWEFVIYFAVSTWPFLVIPGIASAGPVVFYFRKRRLRQRRAELQRSEWMLD
jgi:hypothetical protein